MSDHDSPPGVLPLPPTRARFFPLLLTLTALLGLAVLANSGGAASASPTGPALWQTPTVAPGKHPDAWRFGVGVDLQFGQITDYDVNQLGAGWWADWHYRQNPPNVRMEYVHLVRVRETVYPTNTHGLTATVRANPGAIWLIGNEPDCSWEDCDYRFPDDTTYTDRQGRTRFSVGYARIYHDLYYQIKALDPTARIANGALVQGTPVRIAYLDAVWDAYQRRYGEPMPIDVVNFHNQMVREVAGEWGAQLPRGFENSTLGRVYTAQDNDNMDLVRDHITRIRQWMKSHGLQNTPLIISEYGILQPPWDGFTADRVNRYMTNTFNYFYFTRDCSLGMADDQCRLVQRWQWFSLNSPPKTVNSTEGWNGGLFDPTTRQITVFGEHFRNYMANLANAATPTPVGTLPPSNSRREAEEADPQGGFRRVQDATASACAYLTDAGNTNGEFTLSAYVPVGGDYYLWARVASSSYADNDYKIVFDRPPGQTGTEKQWRLGTGGFHWELVTEYPSYAPIKMRLNQGVHTWTVISKERGAKFDAFELTKDISHAPTWVTPCATPTPSTFTVDVPLKPGANLVSLPVRPSATTLGQVLGSISGKYNKVYGYFAEDSADPWKVWDSSLPSYANDLTEIRVGRGFWLYASQETTLRLTGQRAGSTSINLVTGANLVGYPRRSQMALSTALGSCANSVSKVYGYDATDSADPWKVWDRTLPEYANDLTMLKPGLGYWVYASQPCTLNFSD